MYLGDDLGALVDSIINGTDYRSNGKVNMLTGVDVLPDFKKDTSDRNRTSPFAFTGNKFEFRALGSSLNIACPNYMLNTMVADELSQFCEELKKADDLGAAAKALIKRTLTEHKNIIFNGDNYSDEWVKEAEKRGLCNYRSLPEAMAHYVDKKNVDLFVRNGIVTEAEIHARYEIELETYSKQLRIEARTMIDMAEKNITPAVIAFVNKLSDAAIAKKQLSESYSVYAETKLIEELSSDLESFVKKTAELKEAANNASLYADKPLELALYYRNTVFALMGELRTLGDAMESKTAAAYWPYPSYADILFGV
jgi:glutamine synthetase